MILFLIRTVRPQIFIYIHGSAQSSAFVCIESRQAFFSCLNLLRLLPEWQEKVLLQPPVQKSPDLRYFFYSKPCHTAHCKLRMCRRSDQTVLRILVEKYFHLIPGLCTFRNLSARKQHLLIRMLSFCQIDPKVYLLHDYQYLCLSQLHVIYSCFML